MAPTSLRAGGKTQDHRLADQLKWLIGLRLVVITSVLLPAYLLQLSSSGETVEFDFLLTLAGFSYVASLVYIGLLSVAPKHLTLQAYLQFVGDLALVTGLVYQFGGTTSPFSMLYLIVISVAAAVLRRRAGVTVAELAWVFYAGLIVSLYFGWVESPTGEPTSIARLTYSLAIHLFGFYAVALLTSYLARDVARVEQELEEKSEDLADLEVFHRDVIESMTSGLVTTDLGGKVTSINRVGRSILDVDSDSIVGSPIDSLGLFSAEKWDELRTASTEGVGRIRDETEIENPEGRACVGFSVGELLDVDGKARGFTLIFQDLTEWRKLQEEVRIKDRMAAVGELAAGLAHEIGNPLAAISGSVQMLSSTVPANSSQHKLLDITLQESRRLDRIIKDFLQYARPKAKQEQRYNIAKLLQQNVQLLRNSEEVSDEHEVEVDLEPNSLSLVGDPDQMSQVFWNLTRNSLRAMPDGGTIRVRGQLDDEVYRISYSDTGRGMSEEERANLFHPFQSFFDGGTGIGMAIVYRIVEEHHGRIVVESEPGVGTTIAIELPAQDVLVEEELLEATAQ
ncbi:MAG: ATP-binding protein [Acidobacteriota bacterium]